MQIKYEDNHVLVAVKEGGICTQGEDGLQGKLKKWIKHRDEKPGNVFLEPIHRLDKPVSGLVLFAKTSKALSRLQKQMREREIQRTYVATIEGKIEGEGTWTFYHKKESYKAIVRKTPFPGAKEVEMQYKGHGSQVSLQLKTGKYHQIRATLALLGCPIVDDEKYGACSSYKEIGLTCQLISFLHPTLKTRLTLCK